ncbi:MAG: glutamate formimidoyltransferase [candidate division NC10 bacterium]|nr:glutamate formimidoyltransferase [candidate division NC10 bacterium]
MDQRVVECVPNFSEGRDRAKLKQITDAIEAVPGVRLLNVDPGADTNRTVVTFVGPPDAVAQAAYQAIAKAAHVIDMTQHHGEHPRMGATDVCPFVPIAGVTMEDCAAIARQVGERVGRELDIPVYLYEAAASRPERKNLATIRKGEYEGLAEKLKDPVWVPDFGPTRFNPRSGATVIGAREFLIAYNVTLNTRDKALAADIAFELREKGRVARAASGSAYYAKGEILTYQEHAYPCGNCDFVGRSLGETAAHCEERHGYDLAALLRLNDVDPTKPLIGQKAYRAGKFPHCKAIGWYVEQYKRAQISINLTNYRVTPPYLVLEEVRRLAALRGLVVTGSEVVGLIPYPALLEAGRFYLRAQGKSPFVPIPDILQAAVFSMGLADVSPFDIRTKVIGLPREAEQALVKLNVRDFTDEVSRDTPAPGGGSVAALAGALGAGLASMVANLCQDKVESEASGAALLAAAEAAQGAKDRLLLAVDEDTQTFNAYLEARRLPANTPGEKQARDMKTQEGLKQAVNVPYRTAQDCYAAMEAAATAIQHGNLDSISDGAVGVQVAFAGVRGGIWNVLINLKDITDPVFVTEMRAKCEALLAKARALLDQVTDDVDQRLTEQKAGG